MKLYWRWHDSSRRRVWREDWSGDSFEIYGQDGFSWLATFALDFGFFLVEVDD